MERARIVPIVLLHLALALALALHLALFLLALLLSANLPPVQAPRARRRAGGTARGCTDTLGCTGAAERAGSRRTHRAHSREGSGRGHVGGRHHIGQRVGDVTARRRRRRPRVRKFEHQSASDAIVRHCRCGRPGHPWHLSHQLLEAQIEPELSGQSRQRRRGRRRRASLCRRRRGV